MPMAAMLGQGYDVREAHSAPPGALRAGHADLQGADGRSYELAIYLDRREPGIVSVVDIPCEPLTCVALPWLLGRRAAFVKQKGPKAQKLGAVLGLCGPQAAWADLGHFAMLARAQTDRAALVPVLAHAAERAIRAARFEPLCGTWVTVPVAQGVASPAGGLQGTNQLAAQPKKGHQELN